MFLKHTETLWQTQTIHYAIFLLQYIYEIKVAFGVDLENIWGNKTDKDRNFILQEAA